MDPPKVPHLRVAKPNTLLEMLQDRPTMRDHVAIDPDTILKGLNWYFYINYGISSAG